MERVAQEAERGAHQSNLKELYMKTKLLSGCLEKPSTGIRTKDGKVDITTEEEVLERWKDNIRAEMLKASPAIALNQLLNICNQTLDQCKARLTGGKPSWPKYPKRPISDNYRGISLLSVP